MRGWGGARGLAWCASLAVLAWSAPALCGEEILYQPAPDWIAPVDIAAAAEQATTNLVVFDRQVRLEDGRLWEYADTAYRIATPQELTQAGTISGGWLPDKGDLIVHEVAILRGDEVIDVLGQGAKLSILRREQALEQRVLDGELTATLAVPGLQVGDVLRTRMSVTRADQALGDEVESLSLLFREPEVRPGFARVLTSWEHGAPIRFEAGPDVALPAVETREGYDWLDLTLPLPKAEEMPQDAPMRFLRPTLLQVGTFADWAEVAATMAPHYDVADSIAQGSVLAEKAAGIRSAHAGRLSQAVAALELVQEEIGYLANGLDGGNYLPQSPQQTWDLRYGDCKAKTKLLLALLAELGIEAEAVLVSTEMGDALPQLLPMAGVFDHVLVRARIEGNDYWLDGTSAGASVKVAGNVPPFGYGLPLRASGAELEPIVQVLPRAPEPAIAFEIDMRAGIDIPALVTSRLELVGPIAAYISAGRGQMTKDETLDLAAGMISPFLGPQQVTEVEFAPGADDSEMGMTVRSLMTSPARYEGAQGKLNLPLPSAGFTFNPDRARRAWREVPVATGSPMAAEITFDVLLPEGGRGVVLGGPAQVDELVAQRRFRRSAQLEGERLKVVENVTVMGGEIPAGELAAERRKAAALARNALEIRPAPDAQRRWRFAGDANRSPLRSVEEAYASLIARDPDLAENYTNRASFRLMTYDFAGAAEDLTEAIELEGSAQLYAMRAQAHAELLDDDAVLMDLEEAYALEAAPGRAMALAHAMANIGDLDGARVLLEEQQGGDADMRRSLAQMLAELDARQGDPAGGIARLDALLAERGNDAILLNAKCWYMGTWQVALAEALPVCTRAVESAGNSAPVLDSRALVHLRNGRLAEALADADAALTLAPTQTQTLLLRGIIRRAQGDAGGEQDIRQAGARSPAVVKEYRRYGFDLPI